MAKFRDVVVRAALVLSLLVPVYFLIAALGTKFGLMPWTFGFGQMTGGWGIFVLGGAGVLALLALLLALFVPPRRGAGSALIALLIPALGIGYGVHVIQQARSIPPIHDISTDPVDPPQFSEAVVRAREAVPGHNDLELVSASIPDVPRAGQWAGMRVVDIQQQAYPDIAHVSTSLPPAEAFDHALAVAQDQPWEIGVTDRAGGRIEATARTFWYGFTDDVVIRVRPEGVGSRIDVRSVSRVGGSDLGANAARVRPYLQTLRERLA